MHINEQTRKKVEEIKGLIEKGQPYAVIKALKFSGSKTKMEEWLLKNNHSFTLEELKHLKFVKKAKTPNSMEEYMQLSTDERLSALVEDKVFRTILELHFGEPKQQKKLEIPIEYSRLKGIKVVNCRLSKEIYKKFTDFCEKKNVTITAAINYILDDFVERHK